MEDVSAYSMYADYDAEIADSEWQQEQQHAKRLSSAKDGKVGWRQKLSSCPARARNAVSSPRVRDYMLRLLLSLLSNRGEVLSTSTRLLAPSEV